MRGLRFARQDLLERAPRLLMSAGKIGKCFIVPKLRDKEETRPVLIVVHFFNAANGIVIYLAMSLELIKVQGHVCTD